MSIQSTRDITRESAISRIKEITLLLNNKDYLAISECSLEPYNIDLQKYVDAWEETMPLANINKWTNEMLGDYMDNPFFRYSMFENYLIKERRAR